MTSKACHILALTFRLPIGHFRLCLSSPAQNQKTWGSSSPPAPHLSISLSQNPYEFRSPNRAGVSPFTPRLSTGRSPGAHAHRALGWVSWPVGSLAFLPLLISPWGRLLADLSAFQLPPAAGLPTIPGWILALLHPFLPLLPNSTSSAQTPRPVSKALLWWASPSGPVCLLPTNTHQRWQVRSPFTFPWAGSAGFVFCSCSSLHSLTCSVVRGTALSQALEMSPYYPCQFYTALKAQVTEPCDRWSLSSGLPGYLW